MRRGKRLQGRAQGERRGCQLGAQVRSWTRAGVMAGPRQGAWPAAPLSGASARACTSVHPPPRTLREGAEPGERRWRKRRGNLRWTSSWRLPCGGSRPAPRPASSQSLREGEHPHTHTKKSLQQQETRTVRPPSHPEVTTSLGLRVVSRW